MTGIIFRHRRFNLELGGRVFKEAGHQNCGVRECGRCWRRGNFDLTVGAGRKGYTSLCMSFFVLCRISALFVYDERWRLPKGVSGDFSRHLASPRRDFSRRCLCAKIHRTRLRLCSRQPKVARNEASSDAPPRPIFRDDPKSKVTRKPNTSKPAQATRNSYNPKSRRYNL